MQVFRSLWPQEGRDRLKRGSGSEKSEIGRICCFVLFIASFLIGSRNQFLDHPTGERPPLRDQSQVGSHAARADPAFFRYRAFKT